MTTSAKIMTYDFEIPNNGDFSEVWGFVDKATGASLLTSDDEVMMDFKRSLGEDEPSVFSLRTNSDPTTTGFVLDDEVNDNGKFQTTIRRGDLDDVVEQGKRSVLYYDCGIKYAGDDFFIVYVRGKCTVNKGVTNAG